MPDERLNSQGNVRFRWYPDGSFSNLRWPTVAELNAGQELEQVTLWDSFSVGVQASDTADAVPIAAKANVVRRAAANYGGNASFWYPGYRDDLTNAAALVYQALKELHTPGYVVLSVDGEIGDEDQPPSDFTFEHGDYLTIMKVITDEWSDAIVGEDPFSYTRNFLKAGGLAVYTVASTTAPVLEVTADGATSGDAGDKLFVSGTINGRDWTRGILWTTSDPEVATVSNTGVITLVGDGEADIVGTVPGSTSLITDSITVAVGE